jgi:hypothetical protein
VVSISVNSQTYFFQREFGNFEEAIDFKASPTGFFYIIDNEKSEVVKIDSSGEVIKYNGGYGWDDGLFDNPVDITISGLNVLVTDKNNHRIQIFDSDLNYLAQLKGTNKDNSTEEDYFKYPISCTASSMGDIFILDSENRRILKMDPSGKFLLKFGDYESGEYTLRNPAKIDAGINYLFALDDERILLFDLFGNGLMILKTGFELTNLDVSYNKIFFNSKSALFEGEFIQNTFEIKKIILEGFDFNSDIIKCSGDGNTLFVLLKDRIVQFKNKKG